jgi:hypothetical protein
MAKAKTSSYNFPVNSESGLTNLNIKTCFNISYKEAKDSPIDTFLKNGRQLSQLLDTTIPHSEILANLILLGYISSVESYFRHIIRKIILIDREAFKACELIEISFGAAFGHNNNDLMPEVLLEKTSFANQERILKAFIEFLGLKRQAFPPDVKKILDEFSIVCELRHCIVHRSGKLGAKNAIKLGLDEHSGNIEKPLHLNPASLAEIISVCHNTVKVLNNFLYKEIMMRIIAEYHKDDVYTGKINNKWTWIYEKDKEEFKRYFGIFISKISPPLNSKVNDAYNTYKKVYESLPKGN